MNNFKFVKYVDENNQFDTTKVVHYVQGEDLHTILDAFSDFLRGCGFHFSGQVGIVEDPYQNDKNDEIK